MKKLSLFVSLVVVGLWADAAMGQYSGGPRTAAATRSVLKQADEVEWADYRAGSIAGPGMSGCPDAHVTCPTGVCYGYDNCCCRPHLLCCLKKIGRMLDCLLPCHKCCPNECVFGVCRPHLFDCGHCGGCGGHGMGCAAPSCSTPMDYPGASDPVHRRSHSAAAHARADQGRAAAARALADSIASTNASTVALCDS